MKKASLCFAVALLAGPAFWAGPLRAEEQVLEVDLGETQPTETPVPPTATPVPEAPTATPTPTAAEAVATPAPASPEASATPDLGAVRFDQGSDGKDGGADEGLMIIAPGAASPEDSLESFGIDSPFNWKNGKRRQIKPGTPDTDEALELEAPESSDLRDRVRLETGEGAAVPTDSDYDLVERVGLVLSASEYRVDGRVARMKDGQYFARRGEQVALRMEPGRQIYPGSVYTVYRDGGIMRTHDADAQDVGMMVINLGVVKVIRIEGEEVMARVEKQYGVIREGDLVRLRDPERLRYYNSLRQTTAPGLDLKGEILGVQEPFQVAKPGQVVYINVGRKQGAHPGMRLMISRDVPDVGRDGIRELVQTGRIGLVEVINTGRDACVARVVQSRAEIRPGDKVRLR